MQKPPGKFVVLEGPSGSGKSTVHNLLSKEFPHSFFNIEPTNHLFGAVIRSVYNRQAYPEKELDAAMKYCGKGYGSGDEDFWLLVSHTLSQVKLKMTISEMNMQFLFMADRVYDLQESVIPCRNSGITVIQDRYLASMLAVGASGGLSMDKLAGWQMKAFRSFGITEDIWKPDFMIIFDVEPVITIERLKSSGKVIDVFEEKLERLAKVREMYLQLAKRTDIFPHVAVIDASVSPEKVFGQVVQLIKSVTVSA